MKKYCFSFSKSVQIKIWDEASNAAGPRYTKDINVELPIKELFEGIARTDRVFIEIEELKKKVTNSFKSVVYKKALDYKVKIISTNLAQIQELGGKFIKTIKLFGKDPTKNLDLKLIVKEANKVLKYFSPIERFIWDLERKESQEQRKKAQDEKREYFGYSESAVLRNLKDLERTLNEFQRAIRSIEHFSKGYKARLVNEPFLLVLGQAGMGKTHLVCDITKDRIARKLPPTVIVLGEKLLDINDSLESIFKACSIKGTNHQILKELNEKGKRKKSRSLIIIDAVNEADRKGWKSGLTKLIKQIKKYPWIGLVMTCRIPFQYLSLPKRFKIITEYHHGFAENELEAMTVFFNFYGIPLPEVPLLISEFSSPLFLSCFCKTAKTIKGGQPKVAQGIQDLALGQVGMTKILEDFYITKEKQIVKKHSSTFGLLIKNAWIWNKSGDDCLIKMVARSMANSGQRYLKNDEAINILKQLSFERYREATCSKILNILIEEGVLIRDAAWDDQTKQYFDVIKFSFHKFSDHIIARYLLEKFFDRNKVKKSLAGSNALGKLFRDEQAILNNIDLIEALMVEFPERIKKKRRLHDKDLIDFLPKNVRPLPQVRSALIESLYWRKPENFWNKNKLIKKSIIVYINKTLLRYENSSRELLDLLVSTATKPFHPLNAKLLSDYLFGLQIPNRDLFWTEYLRKQYGAGSIYKLVSWIENQNLKKIAPDQAWCVITILGWVLTTNVRLLRNRASRCVYAIGKIQPEMCFKATLELSFVNDPYVCERMLAASYGVVMALHSDQNNACFLKTLYPFAKSIYSLFFKKNASCSTTNVLIRDYARWIIEVALVHKKKLLSPAQIKRIRPLYKDGGVRRWGRSSDKDEGKYRDGNAPLGMDFENYTLGHLVPNRRNYDNSNKDFIQVVENVLWRIYQLGYSLKRFGDIDKSIASDTRMSSSYNYQGQIDRYGKKYSWIAYYELVGLKMDKKNKSQWVPKDGRIDELDIDPSFPETPLLERGPLISANLTKGPRKIKKWLVQRNSPDISPYFKLENIEGIKGPWVLVHGTIGQKNTKIKKRVTTFVTGLLVDKKQEAKIKELLSDKAFPGENIPPTPEIRKTFTGELGWHEDSKKEDPSFIKIKRGEKKIRLSKQEMPLINIITYGNSKDIKKGRKPLQYRIEPIYEEVPVELLARWFYSENYSYLGRDYDRVGLYIPSKKFIHNNKLHTEIASFNLLDSKNKVASISFISGDQYGTGENLLYMRKDIVDKILKKSAKKLYLFTWGERQFWLESGFAHRKDLAPIYQAYKNVYKKIIEYIPNLKRPPNIGG